MLALYVADPRMIPSTSRYLSDPRDIDHRVSVVLGTIEPGLASLKQAPIHCTISSTPCLFFEIVGTLSGSAWDYLSGPAVLRCTVLRATIGCRARGAGCMWCWESTQNHPQTRQLALPPPEPQPWPLLWVWVFSSPHSFVAFGATGCSKFILYCSFPRPRVDHHGLWFLFMGEQLETKMLLDLLVLWCIIAARTS